MLRVSRAWAPILGLFALLALLVGCNSNKGTCLAGQCPDAGAGDARVIPMGGMFCDLPGSDAPGVKVPDGFCARKFADVKTPRVLAFAPNGDLFAASPSASTPGGAPSGIGGLYVLPDDDMDGVADSTTVFMKSGDLSTVHGLAFKDNNTIVYTVRAAVFSIPYTSGDRSGDGKSPTMIADLSDQGGSDRWTHGLSVASDGQIYVSRGQYDSSNCAGRTPRSGSVLRIGATHDLHGDMVIGGMRNPLHIRCAPWGACYAAELSGDNWERYGGFEKLIELKDGDDYGYPCCVDVNNPVPGISPTPDCSTTASSVFTYHLHDTPFGFDWDTQGLWPAPMTNAIFVGFHGSFFDGHWGGTRLGWAAIDPGTHRPMGQVQTLASGFDTAGPVRGRVTDVVMAPDGRVFFSDDQGGSIYWVAPKSLRRP
jgi:glucose/arabinose dehydrogenase